MSHAMDGYLKNHQSYIEKLPKNRKNDPFNRKKWNFQKMSKVFKIPRSKGVLCSPRTDRHTETQTDRQHYI